MGLFADHDALVISPHPPDIVQITLCGRISLLELLIVVFGIVEEVLGILDLCLNLCNSLVLGKFFIRFLHLILVLLIERIRVFLPEL